MMGVFYSTRYRNLLLNWFFTKFKSHTAVLNSWFLIRVEKNSRIRKKLMRIHSPDSYTVGTGTKSGLEPVTLCPQLGVLTIQQRSKTPNPFKFDIIS